jgi:hypothetical protein
MYEYVYVQLCIIRIYILQYSNKMSIFMYIYVHYIDCFFSIFLWNKCVWTIRNKCKK